MSVCIWSRVSGGGISRRSQIEAEDEQEGANYTGVHAYVVAGV
jgi:hypothetical protein